MEKVKWGREVTPPEYEVGVIVQSLHVVGLFDDSGWVDGCVRMEEEAGWTVVAMKKRGSTEVK